MRDAPDPAPPDRSEPRIFSIQFFLLPALVALPFVLLVGFVGWLSQEEVTPRALVREIREGTPHRRWQAAMHLALHLQRGETGGVTPADLLSVWESDAAKAEPQVRSYLLLAFSRTPDPRILSILSEAAASTDPNERLQAVWSLSLWRDPSAAEALARALEDADPSVRKMAAGGTAALDGLDTAVRVARLRPLLGDPSEAVRWNVAIILGRWGIPEAEPVLVEALDRAKIERVPGIRTESVETILIEAAGAARAYPNLAGRIRRLADSDSSLAVRAAARAADRERDSADQ